MVETLKTWIARKLAPHLFDEVLARETAATAREKALDDEVGRRAAAIVMKMDPFELVMREFSGVFGEDFEHPEDNLDARGVLNLQTFGYTLANDPSFIFLSSWIMNSQGNETFLRAPVPDEKAAMMKLMYGRAQISSMLTFRKEVRRLSAAYEDVLAKQRGESFDPSLSTE